MKTSEFQIKLPPLTVGFTYSRAVLHLAFTGKITEDVNLGLILNEIVGSTQGRLILDLTGISSMNSCGIREWIMFLEMVDRLIPYHFSHVGEALIELTGTIPTVLGQPDVPIELFDAPFACPKCQERTLIAMRPVDVAFLPNGEIEVPAQLCPKCKRAMEFDGIEAEYFGVLKLRPRIVKESGD